MSCLELHCSLVIVIFLSRIRERLSDAMIMLLFGQGNIGRELNGTRYPHTEPLRNLHMTLPFRSTKIVTILPKAALAILFHTFGSRGPDNECQNPR